MDPIGNQPAQNPQQPPIQPTPTPPSAPVAPTPQAEVRPAQATPPVNPLPERPVEAWPPAGTPAAAEAQQLATTPVVEPITSPNPPAPQDTTPPSVAPEGVDGETVASTAPINPTGMDGFVSPAAKEIKETTVSGTVGTTENPMSDQQADKLFQEEPATKERNKRHKLKKVLLTLLALVIISVLGLGGYIFFFGNKAAQNYSDSALTTNYIEIFSQIEGALAEEPVNKAELEAGFNKLKVATANNTKLSPVFLGSLNPNYKEAKEFSTTQQAYTTKVAEYKEKYADYLDYIKAVSDSLSLITKLDALSTVDVATTPAETILSDLNKLLTSCNESVKSLSSSTKPADSGEASESLATALTNICSESMDSLEDGIIVFLTGKTGVLSAADQEQAKTSLASFASTSSNIKTNYQVNLDSLNNYLSSILSETKALQQ